MEEYIPEIIEPIPIIQGVRCKLLLYIAYVIVSFSPLFLGLILWYMYNIFIGVAFFLFITLAMGVVLSKMRITSIPKAQREINYTNLEVSRWFLSKNICFDIEKGKDELV